MQKALDQGCVYFHGRDKNFRPFLIVKVIVFQAMKSEFTSIDSIMVGIVAFEYFLEHLAIKGRIENINIVLDCKDLNVFTAPYRIIIDLLGAIQSQFKCICKSIFCLNSPSTFSILYNGVKAFLQDHTKSKLQIYSESTSENLLKMAMPHQIEKKYGGTAQDVESKFWPAIMPSNDFGVDKSLVENFVHESKYRGSGKPSIKQIKK